MKKIFITLTDSEAASIAGWVNFYRSNPQFIGVPRPLNVDAVKPLPDGHMPWQTRIVLDDMSRSRFEEISSQFLSSENIQESNSNIIKSSLKWGERAYIETNSLGGFRGNTILVIDFQTSTNSYLQPGRAQFGELYDGPTFRQMTLSKTPADFRTIDPTGINGPVAISNGTSTFMTWNVGNSPLSLEPNQKYYFNIRNYSMDLGKIVDDNISCNGLFELYWPH
mgnify:CR=1 FL=1